ncbi:hypothetical protein HK405_008826 [Cladochytrium tenue]|nr:hypothetical protein HK405_008826 [Cladochytrium tenue]
MCPIQVVFDHTQRWTALDEPRRLRWVSERNEKLLGRYTLRRTVLSLNIVVERVREGVAQFAAEAAGMAPGTAVAAAAAVEAARRLGPDIDALPAYVHVDSGDSESPPRLEGSEAPPEAPAVAPAVAASGVPGGAHNDQAAPPAYG